jgi:hypothetical protein
MTIAERFALTGGIAIFAFLIGAAAGTGYDAVPMTRPMPTDAVAVTDLPPCVSEDSDGLCYWDASVRGNGSGHSFVAVPGVGAVWLD